MKTLLSILTICMTVSAYADLDMYPATIKRDGLKKKVTIQNWWAGEYPNPVIKVEKQTTISVYLTTRDDQAKAVPCTVEKGIYHPWAAKYPKNLENYYTITSYLEGEVTSDPMIIEQWSEEAGQYQSRLPKGTKVSSITYLSEGYCMAKVDLGGEKKSIEFDCGAMERDMKMVSTEKTFNFGEQWIALQCEEGMRGFVKDEDFLKENNVVEGDIIAYGEVK